MKCSVASCFHLLSGSSSRLHNLCSVVYCAHLQIFTGFVAFHSPRVQVSGDARRPDLVSQHTDCFCCSWSFESSFFSARCGSGEPVSKLFPLAECFRQAGSFRRFIDFFVKMLIVCDRNAFVYQSNVPARRLACAHMRILVFSLGFTLSSACSSTSFFESLAVLCARSQFFREESLFFPTLFNPSFLHFLAPSKSF